MNEPLFIWNITKIYLILCGAALNIILVTLGIKVAKKLGLKKLIFIIKNPLYREE